MYISQKIADRLREYIQDKGIGPEKQIFPITYNAALIIVKKAGKLAGVNLRPHDLRRHAATHASRSGTPIEIVSKTFLHFSSVLLGSAKNSLNIMETSFGIVKIKSIIMSDG
jgi:integrase